ncbi:MAG TPA: hypothetical protein VG326_02330 [Tepidisphaeraceae bacterium]|jgi:hypothetical protein|nr:hypothetical protein [Tepidisphaeraceae bacterium]
MEFSGAGSFPVSPSPQSSPSKGDGAGTATAPAIPNLRPARFEDYPQIERLESTHGLLTLSPQDWRNLWLDNPLRPRLGDSWPFGWVLENSGGQVVGSLANIPTLYTFRGQRLIAATGRAWVVAAEYRGAALWLMDEYFNQEKVDLFINTTVNSLAVDTFATFGSTRVPAGDWESAAYRITNYRGFARAALGLKGVPMASALAPFAGAALSLKDAVARRSIGADTSHAIEFADHFDGRFDDFWPELVGQNPDKLLNTRDRQTLNWHFSGPLRAGQLWVLSATRNGLLRAYCILKRQDHPQSGLIRMRLVDYQSTAGADDLLPPLLEAAAKRCVAERIHVLEHVGCGLPKMRAFERFAPYRRALVAWPYYYHAADSSLNEQLRDPALWEPSAFDGDSSL